MRQLTDTLVFPVPEPAILLAAVPSTADQFPRIAGYRFLRRLGQGGMATVYLATQESLGRPVSIKVVEREALQDEISRQRFENEARTIAQFTHPGIVGIHEVGRTDDGQMYYIMPYLANGDLSRSNMRNDEPRIVEVLRTLLSALGYAHDRGTVHRDVKQENILLDSNNQPLLADFGISLSRSDTSRLTTAGLSVGSSGYMSPEQARGEEVDARADLYSVGVLTYVLLTGEMPFHAPDALGLALKHAQDAIPRLPRGKRQWQHFIDRAMAKSPAQRFHNAQQMLVALDAVRSKGRQVAGGAPGSSRSRKKGSGSRRMLALCSVLLASIALFAANAALADHGGLVGALIRTPQPTMLTLAPKKIATPIAAAVPPGTSKTHRKPVQKRNWISRLFHRN
jgi:serine/threonine-protein kinase PpkA